MSDSRRTIADGKPKNDGVTNVYVAGFGNLKVSPGLGDPGTRGLYMDVPDGEGNTTFAYLYRDEAEALIAALKAALA